jgi:hypothetical protein
MHRQRDVVRHVRPLIASDAVLAGHEQLRNWLRTENAHRAAAACSALHSRLNANPLQVFPKTGSRVRSFTASHDLLRRPFLRMLVSRS